MTWPSATSGTVSVAAGADSAAGVAGGSVAASRTASPCTSWIDPPVKDSSRCSAAKLVASTSSRSTQAVMSREASSSTCSRSAASRSPRPPSSGGAVRGSGTSAVMAASAERTADSRIGRATRSPWTRCTPRRRSTCSCSGVSTPLATTAIPKAWAIATTPPTNAPLPASSARPATKERSTLTTSTGSWAR